MCLKTLNVQQVRATSKTKMPPFNCAHEMLLNLWQSQKHILIDIKWVEDVFWFHNLISNLPKNSPKNFKF